MLNCGQFITFNLLLTLKKICQIYTLSYKGLTILKDLTHKHKNLTHKHKDLTHKHKRR